MAAWSVVIVGVALLVVVGVVLVRQRFPGDLSEREDRPKRQGRHVMERPANASAEAMGVDGPGEPTADPEATHRPGADNSDGQR